MLAAILTILLILLLLVIAPLYLLYGLYAAVMNFKRAKDAGKLSRVGLVLGYPYFILGMALDIYCNTIPLSILLLEPPKFGEFTVTARMTRLQQTGGWRGDVARWFCEELMDGLDPDWKHCE